MNERTRYEQSLADQLNNLQLPDEDQAWLAMKKLLDEKDDDGAIVLPPPRKGCGLWGVALLLLLVAGGLIYYFTQKDSSEKDASTKIPGKESQSSRTTPAKNLSVSDSSGHLTEPGRIGIDSVTTSSDLDMDYSTSGTGESESLGDISSSSLAVQKNERKTKPGVNKKNPATDKARSAILVTPGNGEEGSDDEKRKKDSVSTDVVRNVNISPGKTDDINQPPGIKNIVPDREMEGDDSIHVIKEVQPDTISKTVDSLKVEIEKTDSSKNSEDSITKKKKGFSFALGVAEQHAFPINGTESVSNGLLGRKSSLADYIPSLYLRLYRENRWFLQSEFKYGAPQYVKEFAYRNIVEIDTFQTSSTRTFYLRKTFYHQVPLSFHYFVLPGWSVGTGVVYNRFQGTISEEFLRIRLPGTIVDSIVETKMIDHKQDSSFKKNTWQWMIETQYKWKRFSIGARYAQGLQPYIEYTDLQGIPQSKKHQSFNIFLRYELWRSKQK